MKLIPLALSNLKTTAFSLFAVMLSVGFTACEDDTGIYPEDEPSKYEPVPTIPTTDSKEVSITGNTFVFNGNYTGEGKALTDRVTTRAASLDAENVKNIIIHSSDISSLTNAEISQILLKLCSGASLVIADPTAESMKMLAEYLRGVIDIYSEGGNDEASRQAVNQILGSEILDRILSWTDSVIDDVFKNEQNVNNNITLLAICDNDSYFSFRDSPTDNYTLVINDENGNLIEEAEMAIDGQAELDDYQNGKKADILANWLNTPKESEEQKAASRLAAAQMMATRAGGDAQDYLDKITDSKDYTFPVGFTVAGPDGHKPFHHIVVKYRIWTAYSGEKKFDVYCVTQEITLFNQDLKCGPSDKYTWYNAKNWEPWKALDKKTSQLRSDVYGPYMYQVDMRCKLIDGSHAVTLEEYAPQNSTSGGGNVTNGFSFSLGASVSAKSGGPEAGISTSMQWSHSVSRFDADLKMTASPTSTGEVNWKYVAKEPDSHFNPNPIDGAINGAHTHESAVSITTTTCTLQQGWVWTVKGSTSTSVVMNAWAKVTDHWLTYDRSWAWGKFAKANPHYIGQSNNANAIPSIILPAPPRYHQNWSMSVESDDVDPGKLKEIETYLAQKLSQYYMNSFVFSAVKADHKKTTNLGFMDEVGTFIAKSKKAFTDNRNVVEILQMAGKVAGVPSGGSYTIIWRQTDLDVNSDREEFTFKMP